MVIAMVISMSIFGYGLVKNRDAGVEAAGECRTELIDAASWLAIKPNRAGTEVHADFIVHGGPGCQRPVTLAVWKMPNAQSKPKDQTLFSHTSRMYGPGRHTIRATLPDCTWQADILWQMRPKSIHGDARYDWPQDILANFRVGGTKPCEAPKKPPVTPVTPTPDQPVPEQPVDNVTTVPAEFKGEELVNTGPGDVFLGFGASGALGTAVSAYLRSRKGLLDSLLG